MSTYEQFTGRWRTVTQGELLSPGDRVNLSLSQPETFQLQAEPRDFNEIYFANMDGSLGDHVATIDGNGHPIGTPEAGYTDEITVNTANARFLLQAYNGKWSLV